MPTKLDQSFVFAIAGAADSQEEAQGRHATEGGVGVARQFVGAADGAAGWSLQRRRPFGGADGRRRRSRPALAGDAHLADGEQLRRHGHPHEGAHL